ncbi:SDR family oxidoreductase [Myxococcota bacterium]|nr:SDR family oxidoreductase [Myxococcota bacterium]
MAGSGSGGLRTYTDAVALISGGASGIGAALARALVAQGARVVLADRQLELAQNVAGGLGERARAVALDVREAEAYVEVAAGVLEREGRIDYFFNNAGIGIGGLYEDHSLDDWRYIVDVNLLGVVYGISAVYPILLEQGFGHIVNTASMAGRAATPGLSAYCATKHAVVGLTRSLRIEAQGRGVGVSAFCPGVIRTEILKDGGVYGKFAGGMAGDLDEEQLERARPMEVDAFAKAALIRVARNQEIIVLPGMWRFFDGLYRLIPGVLSRFMAQGFFKEYERIAQARSSG